MGDPQINFVGTGLLGNDGSLTPFSFNSSHLLLWVFRGNVPDNIHHVGWFRGVVDSDVGINGTGNVQRLYIGRTKIFIPIFPFSPPFQIEIITKPWIEQLDVQFYEIILSESQSQPNSINDPNSDPQDPRNAANTTGNSYGGMTT